MLILFSATLVSAHFPHSHLFVKLNHTLSTFISRISFTAAITSLIPRKLQINILWMKKPLANITTCYKTTCKLLAYITTCYRINDMFFMYMFSFSVTVYPATFLTFFFYHFVKLHNLCLVIITTWVILMTKFIIIFVCALFLTDQNCFSYCCLTFIFMWFFKCFFSCCACVIYTRQYAVNLIFNQHVRNF